MAGVLADIGAIYANLRYRHPFVTEGTNKKLVGTVNGILQGGKLITSPSSQSVIIDVDPDTGLSVYNYERTTGTRGVVTIVEDAQRTLDLSAEAGNTVFVCLYVEYTTTTTTLVQFRSYSESELFGASPVTEAGDVLILGQVEVPATAIPIPSDQIVGDRRTDAWQRRSVGARDWTQTVLNGSGSFPAEGVASTEYYGLPGWFVDFTGGTGDVQHSSTYKRSFGHSLRVEADGSIVTLGPGARSDPSAAVYHPIKAGQRILFSFYKRAVGWSPASSPDEGVVYFHFNTEPISTGGSDVYRNFDANGTDSDWELVTGVVEAPSDGWFYWYFIFDGDSPNTGYVYLDDIRMWVEPGSAFEDEGASALEGLNSTIVSSALWLPPADHADSVTELCEGTAILINRYDSSGVPNVEFRTRTFDLFNYELYAHQVINGRVHIDFPPTTGSTPGLYVQYSSTAAPAIRGEGIFRGVYGYAVPGSLAVSDIGGVVGDMPYRTIDNVASVGVLGRGEGAAGTKRVGIGVVGVATHDETNPNIFSEFNCGVFGYGDRSYGWSPVWPPEGTGVGGVFHGADVEGNQPGLSGIDEVSGSGIFARGGQSYGYGGAGGYFIGGRRSATPPHGSPGVRAYGGNSGSGTGYHGGVGGVFVAGERSDATAEHGVGIYAQYNYPENEGHGARLMGRDDGFFGACVGNELANVDIEALAVNAGIVFRQRSGIPGSQNPAYSIGLKNTLKALGVPKAWARVECTTTNPTIIDGMNIASADYYTASTLRIFLAEDLQDAAGCVICTSMVTGGFLYFQNDTIAADQVRLKAYDGSGTLIASLSGTNYDVCVVVFGRQTPDDFPDFNNTI